MLELCHDEHHITISDDRHYTVGSVDNVNPYNYEYIQGGARPDSIITSHGIRVIDVCGEEVASCVLLATGGLTCVHEQSAIIHDSSCVIAVSSYIVSLALPSLELEWTTEADPCTCFGVYFSDKHQCLISHGELTVARFTLGGQEVWSIGGADIFSNGFSLFENFLEVIDFENRKYRIDLNTGIEYVG